MSDCYWCRTKEQTRSPIELFWTAKNKLQKMEDALAGKIGVALCQIVLKGDGDFIFKMNPLLLKNIAYQGH